MTATTSRFQHGLWDDPGLTQSYGNLAPFVTKSAYLRVRLDSALPGLAGIEFSISGIDATDSVLAESRRAGRGQGLGVGQGAVPVTFPGGESR